LVLCGVHVIQTTVFCLMFCISLFVLILFLLDIVLFTYCEKQNILKIPKAVIKSHKSKDTLSQFDQGSHRANDINSFLSNVLYIIVCTHFISFGHCIVYILCCVFVFLRLVYSMLPVSLDCPFIIVPSVFSKFVE
jgi:uncharacterized membrane protein